MLQICICDDDQQALTHLQGLLEQYRQKSPETAMDVWCCHGPEEVLQAMESRRFFDLCILDVVMPGMDGIRLGQRIREKNDACTIIYQTVTPDYALEAYSVSAFHYLLKPLSAETLFPVLDRAVERLSTEQESGYVARTAEGVSFVPYHHLCYVELRNRAPLFHLKEGGVITGVCLRQSLETDLAELLEDGRFLQCHKSYLVNMNCVRQYEAAQFTLSDGAVIPISKRKTADVRRQYLEFMTQKLKSASVLPEAAGREGR